MISFASDYTKGAHHKILERLAETALEQNTGYGQDKYCDSAVSKIKEACGLDDAQIFFLVGGTQTNQVITDMLLNPYEGIVAATTGHIASHEAGAIEHSGHKVLTIDNQGAEIDIDKYGDSIGKISADVLDNYLGDFFADGNHEHMVAPGAVYISHPTEYGTLYTKKELTSISDVCKKYNIPLFLDGARLGYGLMSNRTDVTLKDIASLVDVFYIGGTKVGALFGEAVVFTHKNAVKHPVPIIKQHGALLAKGWLLGLQFDTLFTDDLYFKISKNAIDTAEYMKTNLVSKGYKLFLDSPTNQQFIVIDNNKLESLENNVGYSFWEKYDNGHTVIRLATDWSTTKEDVDKLMQYL